MREFTYSVPKSVRIVFKSPYVRKKCSKIALATLGADLSGAGAIMRYLVRSHIIVTAYLLPSIEVGKGPI